MSREQYTAPNLSTSGATPGTNLNGTTNTTIPTAGNLEETRPVAYLCGDCDAKVILKRGDPIRCKECGYRVLYKQRTNRMIQFEAR